MRSRFQKRNIMIGAILALTAGCAMQSPGATGTASRIGNVPEGVVALAAPEQDISTARLVPEDDCYWYEHRGPVESTLLPLRAPNGRPICASVENPSGSTES